MKRIRRVIPLIPLCDEKNDYEFMYNRKIKYKFPIKLNIMFTGISTRLVCYIKNMRYE